MRRQHFDEWAETLREGDIRLPRARFRGVTGLSADLGLEIPEDNLRSNLGFIADDIAEAYSRTSNWVSPVQFPVKNLMAQHHIERAHARGLFQSIRKNGFDPNEAINIVSDDDGYGVIINGHHRSMAAAAAGMKHIPALSVTFRQLADEVHRG